MRTIKDYACSAFSGIPFRKIPSIMTISLFVAATLWIRAFSAQDGMSPTLIPRPTVTGLDINYNKHYKLEFSEYVQVHEKGNNTIMVRYNGAIALSTIGNSQVTGRLITLTTEGKLQKRKWTHLPNSNQGH